MNELIYASKNDIPFIQAQTVVHQPTINEISLIGEDCFRAGTKFLNFSRELLSQEDKIDLENISDFEIFMSIMCSREKVQYKNDAMMVLALLFPHSQIKLTPKELLLVSEKGIAHINNDNYDAFKDIIINIFGLKDSEIATGEYNPADKRAEKIAEKLRKSKNKKSSGISDSNTSVFKRYVSILAVGEHKDKNLLMEYTVSQLLDEFKRFTRKLEFDYYINAKMAGAQSMEEVDSWMDDSVHS